MRWMWIALAVAGVTGCNASRAVIASPNDYADYRRVRVAEDASTKIAATWHYLKTHPEGRFVSRLKRYFASVEPVFYKSLRKNEEGLEAYLRTLPDGPHAGEALERLMFFRGERRREDVALGNVALTQKQIDARLAKRREAGELLVEWLTMLLDPAVWDRPWVEAPGPLLVRFQLALPQPFCLAEEDGPGERCIKVVSKSYRAPGGGGTDHAVSFDVDLRRDARGVPTRVEIVGGALFVRSEEARRGEAIDDLDEEAVEEARRSFLAHLNEDLLAADRLCGGNVEADGSARFDCEGIRFTIEPGRGAGEDHLIVQPSE